jgi:hypothetical protein
MTNDPLLLSVNFPYFSRLLDWKNIRCEPVGELVKVEGFTQFNHLVEINKIFSTHPAGDIVDRTLTVTGPFNFKVLRPWQQPTSNPVELDAVFKSRVEQYTCQNRRIDLFWSGGADSTALVVAFLTHCANIDQLRLVYSPYSLYENRNFFKFITKLYPKLETIDISGDVYINEQFDNIIVTGHGGDEFTSSLDETFFEKVGAEALQRSWKDFFFNETNDVQLIEFCEEYFSKAGRPIDTLLEARWWFYSIAKSQIFAARDISFLFNQKKFLLEDFVEFYNCQEFEDYMWHNTDKITSGGTTYSSYKKFLREYIHKFFQDDDYLNNTSKKDSTQFQKYRNKKIELLDLRWICLLEDLSIVRTNNLPLLSKKEFDKKYGTSLDYLFNTPN